MNPRRPEAEATDPDIMAYIAGRRGAIYRMRKPVLGWPDIVMFDAVSVDMTVVAPWWETTLVAILENACVVPAASGPGAGYVAVPVEDIGKPVHNMRRFSAAEVLAGACPGARVTHLEKAPT